jgi:valyl-tRNA synthetase
MIKPRLRNAAKRPAAQRILVEVIDTLIRLLHPFAPFITEELWHTLNQLAPVRGLTNQTEATESVMVASWPQLSADLCDDVLEKRFERLQEIIVAIRNVRGLYKISPKEPLKLFMRCAPEVADQMHAVADQFDNLSKTMLEAAGLDVSRPGASANFSLEDADGYIPLEGLIDLDAELERQQKKAAELKGHITGAEMKLSNSNFVDRAPEHVVNDVRETLAGLKNQLENVERIIDELG